MKLREWIIYAAAILAAGALLGGCSSIRKLTKSNAEVGLHQTGKPLQSAVVPPVDTVRRQRLITFRKADGTELTFAPVAVDSLTGEKMMSVSIAEVVISASARRNLVERNGKINVEFVVTVPEEFQHKKWQLAIDPQLQKGSDTLSLNPLVYSGDRFRDMQMREYDRYGKYRSRIVDSADYFDRFGNRRAYFRHMDYLSGRRAEYVATKSRLESMTAEQAAFDKQVGWSSARERRRQQELLRCYVRRTDREAARYATYAPDSTNRLDHLNDYFAPRFRYHENDQVIPGGEVYTRVEGEYTGRKDRLREAYQRSLLNDPLAMRREVQSANKDRIGEMAAQRAEYSGRERELVDGILRQTSDSAMLAVYRIRKQHAADQIVALDRTDTNVMRRDLMHWGKVYRNQLLDQGSDAVFARIVPHPYRENMRLDTVIHRPDGKIDYHYTEFVQADENTSKLYLFLHGGIEDLRGRRLRLQKSDTLTYNVASMTSFLDTTTRYMQRIIVRDAEANARFYFTFPAGKSDLNGELPENRRQIQAVRSLTRALMTDPIYIIDSITLRAGSSPEGAWQINDRLARERAEVLRRVLTAEFKVLYDSLKVEMSITLDDEGHEVLTRGKDDHLPRLPELLRTQSLAEDWDFLTDLVRADTTITDKAAVLEMMSQTRDPDEREARIRGRHPKAYAYMRNTLYPRMRAVDFRFNLHRRGMQQDTVYTTEVDSSYMHAVELLKKRRYAEALEILRPYEDRNTALAYMSLGYDAAAYRILQADPASAATADLQYMLAILAARQGDEQQSVQYFLSAVELRQGLKFRGNLDPEISRLIRKYELFKEDFM